MKGTKQGFRVVRVYAPVFEIPVTVRSCGTILNHAQDGFDLVEIFLFDHWKFYFPVNWGGCNLRDWERVREFKTFIYGHWSKIWSSAFRYAKKWNLSILPSFKTLISLGRENKDNRINNFARNSTDLISLCPCPRLALKIFFNLPNLWSLSAKHGKWNN